MKMTRREIGIILGYKDPQDAIKKIHKRHKTIIVNFVTQKNGKCYYSGEGILEICKLSAQPDRYKRKLLEKLNLKKENIELILNENSNLLKQQNTLEDLIVTVFEGYFQVERLKKIPNTDYTVDMTINNEIILECVEDWHRYKDVEYDKKRETELEGMGYKIIKYVPGDNVKKLINNILKLSS